MKNSVKLGKTSAHSFRLYFRCFFSVGFDGGDVAVVGLFSCFFFGCFPAPRRPKIATPHWPTPRNFPRCVSRFPATPFLAIRRCSFVFPLSVAIFSRSFFFRALFCFSFFNRFTVGRRSAECRCEIDFFISRFSPRKWNEPPEDRRSLDRWSRKKNV